MSNNVSSLQMTEEKRNEITRIAKEFAEPFRETIGEIAGSGWLIVDPLSGYLHFIGYDHEIEQLPANDDHPQILILTFKDGSKFIPAGSDLEKIYPTATDWMWVLPLHSKDTH